MVRLKHRYLLINVLYPEKEASNRQPRPGSDATVPWTVQFHRPSSDDFESKILLRMIRNGVSELFGDYGSGMVSASLQVKYLSTATSTAIIRVSRAHYRLVWAALSFVTRIPKPIDQPCVIQVVRVSGTIKKAEQEAIRRARLAIMNAKSDHPETSSRILQSGTQVVAPANPKTSLKGNEAFDTIEDDSMGDSDDESG